MLWKGESYMILIFPWPDYHILNLFDLLVDDDLIVGMFFNF